MLEYRQMIRKYIEGVVVEWHHLMGNYCKEIQANNADLAL